MAHTIDAMVKMDEQDFLDQMIWIDWRSDEREVIESFSEALHPDHPLTMDDPDHPDWITYRGVRYANPLTSTPADRYVTIYSIAEIIKADYQVLVGRETQDGDTHGFLVLGVDYARDLETRHRRWFKNNLKPLTPGIDGFSGFSVPYTGNEHGGDPQLAQKLAQADARIKARHQRIVERLEGKRPFWKFW